MNQSTLTNFSARSANTDHHSIIRTSLIILIVVACIACIQKYMRYHHLSDYNLLISIFFNFATIVPFIGVIFLSTRFPEILRRSVFRHQFLNMVISGVILFAGYVLSINLVLYAFDLTNAVFLSAFVSKYFTGLIQVHLVLYLFVQFHIIRKRRKVEDSKTVALKKGKAIFNVKLNEIHWIESYGHYLKIHTKDCVYLERDTMKGFMDILDNNFIQIHRKYIVNKTQVDHVCRENGKILVIVEGQKLRVSNSYRDHVKKHFSFV